ncbi:MAG: hypothetical protein OEY28_10440, partial [Nitrospira sp.]|nr:hypothetical protein [Nitrospira sp.]
ETGSGPAAHAHQNFAFRATFHKAFGADDRFVWNATSPELVVVVSLLRFSGPKERERLSKRGSSRKVISASASVSVVDLSDSRYATKQVDATQEFTDTTIEERAEGYKLLWHNLASKALDAAADREWMSVLQKQADSGAK